MLREERGVLGEGDEGNTIEAIALTVAKTSTSIPLIADIQVVICPHPSCVGVNVLRAEKA